MHVFYPRLCLFLLFKALSFGLWGQISYPADFTPHGPGGGGYMYSPSISPFDPNHLFLVCDMGGVYRSQDAGQHWQMQATQQLVSTVKGKVQFTSNPNVLYVCRRSQTNANDPLFRGELAKSTDGGTTWQGMNDPTDSGVHRLEVDPSSTERLLINEYNRLFFSNNGGDTWTEVYHPNDDQMWLGGVFWDGQDIYVGTNKGLLVSHNDGQTFDLEAHAGIPTGLGIYHLAGAKTGGITRLFALSATAAELNAWSDVLDLRPFMVGFYRMNYSVNAAWSNTKSNIPFDVKVTGFDLPRNDIQNVWASGEMDGKPFVYRSDNGGLFWTNTFLVDDNQNISTGWGGDYGAFTYLWSGAALGLDVSDSDPNHVIVTDGFGHVTTNAGTSWQATYVRPDDQNPAGSPTEINRFYHSSGLNVTTSHQLFWLNDTALFSANTDIALGYSADGGNAWSFERNTFYPWGNVANPNWYRIVQRPDNQDLYAALAEINDAYLGYRITDEQLAGYGLVVKSSNQGATWDTIFNFGRPVVWLEIDKTNPNRMFASVVDNNTGGIYRSNNSGANWVKLNLPARTEGHPYNIVSLNDGGLVVTFSARALPDGQTLTESSGVFYSPDGGVTWEDRTAAAMRFYTKDIVVDPHDAAQNTWYATVWGRFTVFQGPNNAGNGGLYKTTNRGQTWTRIWASESAESITIHPEKPGTAYVSAENDGLYFTETLAAAQPVFAAVHTFPWWRPKRIFFHPNRTSEVWVTTMGGGLWNGQSPPDGTVNYLPSTEDFANPERGFMQFTETTASNYIPLSEHDPASWRNLNQPSGADYAIYSTLGYRGFYLETFKNSPISNAYLAAVQQDFETARQAGVKLVVRFAYTQKDTPPFGDAPKNIVLGHIAQLKPLLQANADVIAVLQMGFIGAWGEGYYTDYFGFQTLTQQNWLDRTEVLDALLDALPANRSVQVRIPQMKQKAVYGPSAPPNSAPLTIAEAWQNTAKARIGFVNDCFLADGTDFGTYISYDPNPSGCDTCVFKPYFSEDSQFVPVGGETCSDTLYPYNNCTSQPGGHAQDEMARMHFSYLNSGWNNDVNNDWVSGGCIDEIKQRLGYRLELISGEFPSEVRPGQPVSVNIQLKNKGFAAPFNAHLLRLLLRNTSTNAVWTVELGDDVRRWLAGPQVYELSHTFCMPVEIPEGNYEWLLHIADPAPLLTQNPAYAIRLANQNTWEASTGYNRLLHVTSVRNDVVGIDCNGETCFQPVDMPLPSAQFSASTTSGCAPFVVTFSNESAACWTYDWSFSGGNPAVSSDASPFILYQNEGMYEVGLTVTNTAGSSSQTIPNYITILPLPTAQFVVNTHGLAANFTNISTNATSYSWDFGDNSPVENAANPTHIFPFAGNYNVVLTASNACGQQTFSMLVTVNCLDFSVLLTPGANTILCPGTTLPLLATPGFAQYVWLQNGTPLSSGLPDNIQVNEPGTYQVIVEDSSACMGISNAVLITESAGAMPSFTWSATGVQVSFTNTSMDAVSYVWDFGDGTPTLSEANPSHTFPALGTYTVLLTAFHEHCGPVTFEQVISLGCNLPGVTLVSASGTQVCAGESLLLEAQINALVAFSWFLNGQEIGGETMPSLLATLGGTYQVLVVDSLGCSDLSNPVSVTVLPLPTAVIEVSSPTVCEGETAFLTTDPGFTYQWILPNGSISTSDTILIPSASQQNAGLYTLTLTDANGCSLTDAYFLTMLPTPGATIQASGPTQLVYGESVTLSIAGSWAGLIWSNGSANDQILVDECGLFHATVTDVNGCSASSDSVLVNVQPTISNENGFFMASPASAYQWYLNGQPIVGATDSVFYPFISGEYTVVVPCLGTNQQTSSEVVILFIGTRDLSEGRMLLYPNPITEWQRYLQISLQGVDNQMIGTVVTDVAGREVLSWEGVSDAEGVRLDVVGLPSGVYFLRVWVEGRWLGSGQFVKL